MPLHDIVPEVFSLFSSNEVEVERMRKAVQARANEKGHQSTRTWRRQKRRVTTYISEGLHAFLKRQLKAAVKGSNGADVRSVFSDTPVVRPLGALGPGLLLLSMGKPNHDVRAYPLIHLPIRSFSFFQLHLYVSQAHL